MELIKIDPLKVQPLQTFIHALFKVRRIALRHPLLGSGSDLAALCGDNESFRIRIKRLGDEQFISFGPVSIRGVDQVRAKFHCAPQNFERVLAVGRPTPDPLAR